MFSILLLPLLPVILKNPIQFQLQSNPIQSKSKSNPIQSNIYIYIYPIQPYPIQSNPTQSNKIQSNPIQSNAIQSNSNSNPTQPNLNLIEILFRRNRNRSPGFGGVTTRANSLPQPPIYKCSYICIYMAQASCFPRHASVMVERGRGEPHHTPMQGGASPARYVWRLQRTAHVARKCMCMYTARPHAGQSQCMCIRTLPPLHLS